MAKITTRAAGLGACAAVLAGLGLAAAPAGAAAAPGTAAAAGGWTRYQVPVKGQANLVTVVAPGRDNAWAAGFTIHPSGSTARQRKELRRLASPGQQAPAAPIPCPFTGFLDSLMLHWNGRAWSRVKVPDVNRISYLSAAGPSSAWAVGDCGLLGWNGRSWRLASFPMPAASLQPEPSDVAAISPGNAWLIGNTYNVRQNTGGGFADRWNGRRWQRVSLPASLRLGANYSLSTIDALGPDDVWIDGTAFQGSPSSLRTKIILLHWNGRAWRRLPQPASGLGWYNAVNGVRILSPDDVWVVGWDKLGPAEDRKRLPLALHWNGRRWTTTPVPAGRGELYAAARAGGQVLAVGDTFSPDQTSYTLDILRWTGRAWVHMAVPASGPGSLQGIASVPGGGFWVTGSIGDNTGETGDSAIKPLIARRG
jgi:hypothetical protein